MQKIFLKACSSNRLEQRSPKPRVGGSNPSRPAIEGVRRELPPTKREGKRNDPVDIKNLLSEAAGSAEQIARKKQLTSTGKLIRC